MDGQIITLIIFAISCSFELYSDRQNMLTVQTYIVCISKKKNMDVNEHERLSNSTLRQKLK